MVDEILLVTSGLGAGFMLCYFLVVRPLVTRIIEFKKLGFDWYPKDTSGPKKEYAEVIER